MEYPSIHDWIEKNAIRIVRQGQRNFYVEADVAASIDEPSLRPGKYRLGIIDFERISLENTPTVCLTASAIQKLYALTSGKLDIEGGMSLFVLNSPSLANMKSDLVAPPEPELAYESPIQKALTPYLPNPFFRFNESGRCSSGRKTGGVFLHRHALIG